jgi:hypothetical protein
VRVARSNSKAAKYVYGVVRVPGRSKPAGKGINGKPLRVVASKGIGALTSDVPDEPLEAGREELLTHSRVLANALEDGVVLPMRFGVVMPSEASVRDELLAAHREELEAQLEEMNGKVEVNLKGIYEEEPVLREVLEENPEVAQLRDAIGSQPEDATYYERIRLGELVAEALAAKRTADEEQIVDRLAAQALAVELGQPVHERMALSASFLLERDRIADFDRALDEVAAEHAQRIRFKYTGPLPPHSFVELTVEA